MRLLMVMVTKQVTRTTHFDTRNDLIIRGVDTKKWLESTIMRLSVVVMEDGIKSRQSPSSWLNPAIF